MTIDGELNPPSCLTWLPIETAPKNGTEIIGWSKRHGVHVGPLAPYKRPEMPKRDGGWFKPSHWMPIPSLPNTESRNPEATKGDL
jgi:hypothetical protein